MEDLLESMDRRHAELDPAYADAMRWVMRAGWLLSSQLNEALRAGAAQSERRLERMRRREEATDAQEA
jgi:hypothetical protein